MRRDESLSQSVWLLLTNESEDFLCKAEESDVVTFPHLSSDISKMFNETQMLHLDIIEECKDR